MLADYLGSWELPCISGKQGKGYNWDYLDSFQGRVNQSPALPGTALLTQVILLRSKLLKRWCEGVFGEPFSPALGHVVSKEEYFKLSHLVNPSALEILIVLPMD